MAEYAVARLDDLLNWGRKVKSKFLLLCVAWCYLQMFCDSFTGIIMASNLRACLLRSRNDAHRSSEI